MDSDESNNSYNSESEIDEKAHSKLLENVLNLNKKKLVKKPTRTEPTSTVSEFDLVKGSGNVRLQELAKGLGKSGNEGRLAKKFFKSRAETIEKPAEKIEADRSHRKVAYSATKEVLNKWDPIVTSMRAATTLSFPLVDDNLKKDTDVSNWRIKSDLQQKLEKIDPNVEEIHVDTNQFPLTLQEMMEKRQEAAKMRARMGYELAKAKRVKKIKSKTYHRLQKREKIKQQLKEFELLQKTDPEAALAKLEEIEKVRALERVSLRHKNTGQWAKNKQIRAKYDTESRKVLAQQLSLSKELTQKIKPKNDSDDEEIPQEHQATVITDPSNPWTNNQVKVSKEVDDFVTSYRKYWEEKNKSNLTKSKDVTVNNKNKLNVIENIQINKAPKDVATDLDDTLDDEYLFSCEPVKENDRNLSNEIGLANRWFMCINSESNDSKPSNNEKQSEWKVESVKQIKQAKKGKDKTAPKDFKISDVKFEQKLALYDQELHNKFREKLMQMTKGLKFKIVKNKKKEVVKPSVDMKLKRNIVKPDLDEELIETTGDNGDDETKDPLKGINVLETLQSVEKSSQDIDPKKFIAPKTVYLNADVPNLVTFNEQEELMDQEQQQVIAEAFEDDDVIDEFAQEKADEIEKFNPKEIDLTLPGWGSWGGKNLKVPKRKRDKFTMKVPEKLKRKDDNIGHLIINETPNLKLREHQVTEIPQPFKSVKDFESSIRQPISSSFVPENVFRKLSAPKVATKMGTIIKPMDEDILLKKEKEAKTFSKSFPKKDSRKLQKRRKSLAT